MNNIQVTVEHINALKPTDIVSDPTVRSRFIHIYDILWGAGTGEAAYERESTYFIRQLREKEALLKTTPFSIFTAFIDLAVSGLSIEPCSRALCYLQGRNTKIGDNIGSDGKKYPIFEPRCELKISGYGELVNRAKSGQIRHADNPVLVYEEDEFSYSERDGVKSVSYTCRIPHKSNHVVACYIRITRNDGTTDYSVMFEEDWLRLKEYSLRNNQRTDRNGNKYGDANALYTSNDGSIDTGFLMAKCIKHAFRSYPMARIGRATSLESEQPDESENIDYYGTAEQQPTTTTEEAQPYGNAPDTTAGITINPAEQQQDDDGAF